MASPLRDVRVVELSTMITGPLAGMMLADMGADVVKIERPEGGDPFRSFRSGTYSPHFCAYNRNKRSVVLDLTVELGRRALSRMVEGADVLINNFRPGVMARLGFDDARLNELNPRLVNCSITGYGADGPYSDRPAYDAVAQGLSGMSSIFLDAEEPVLTGPTIADNVSGMYAAYAILAALHDCRRSGTGKRIDVNMLETTIAFMPDPFAYYTHMGLISDATLRVRTSQSYVFRCADDRLINIHLSSQEKFWLSFTTILCREELRNDPRFDSRMKRIENYHDLKREINSIFFSKRRSEWEPILAGADIPFAPVLDVTEVFEDPQVRHLGTFFELSHPTEGQLTSIRAPAHLDHSRDYQPTVAPPTFGEHTDEVLGELGLLQSQDTSR